MTQNEDCLYKRYQKYKLQWMLDHGYALYDLIKELARLEQENTRTGDQCELPDLFDQWEFEVGFRGSIWACYDEWYDNEKDNENE